MILVKNSDKDSYRDERELNPFRQILHQCDGPQIDMVVSGTERRPILFGDHHPSGMFDGDTMGRPGPLCEALLRPSGHFIRRSDRSRLAEGCPRRPMAFGPATAADELEGLDWNCRRAQWVGYWVHLSLAIGRICLVRHTRKHGLVLCTNKDIFRRATLHLRFQLCLDARTCRSIELL